MELVANVTPLVYSLFLDYITDFYKQGKIIAYFVLSLMFSKLYSKILMMSILFDNKQ